MNIITLLEYLFIYLLLLYHSQENRYPLESLNYLHNLLDFKNS